MLIWMVATDAMEELALIMAAAAGQEFIANAMGP